MAAQRPKNKGISCEAVHMYRVVKGVKYRTTSSFLMDQKAKRLNRYKRVKKDIIPEYFKNHISKDNHAVEHRTRALQKHLERLNLDFAEAAEQAVARTRPGSVRKNVPYRASRNSSFSVAPDPLKPRSLGRDNPYQQSATVSASALYSKGEST